MHGRCVVAVIYKTVSSCRIHPHGDLALSGSEALRERCRARMLCGLQRVAPGQPIVKIPIAVSTLKIPQPSVHWPW